MSPTAVTGVVSTGENVAATFTGIDWVRSGLLELVGIDPYPGTLNLTVSDAEQRASLLSRPGVVDLPGQNGACAAKVVPVTVGAQISRPDCAQKPLPAAVIVPVVDAYPETKLELVAALSLREALELSNGQSVTVRSADTLDIEAAIFDLDGTLVDSLEAYFQVAKAAAKNHGETVTRDFVRGTLDANNHAFWELVFTEDVVNRDEVISQVKVAARERWPVDAPKPDPQGLRLAIERMGVAPDRAIYVGDSQVDIQTAWAAGIPGVAVLSGAGTAQTLTPQSPLRVLRSVADFHRLL